MKKFVAFILLIVCILSFTLTGCGASNNYIIQNENVITIGVILSQSEDSFYGAKVLDGINFASELASTVNMNGKYAVRLSVCDINDDISASVSKLVEDKVCAVICAAETKSKSDEIISAFDEYDTPLLFVDCYSNEVAFDEESFAISVPYSYQSSVAASYFISEGFVNGTVVYADDDYSSAFADVFESTFISSGGTNVQKVTEYDAKAVLSDGSEFVFVIGDPAFSNKVYNSFKSAGAEIPVMTSEVFDKTSYESTDYNDMLYISKFESDVNNYIGTDFYNMYSSSKGISKDDVTSVEAYGYDAYMLIYGALMGFGSSYSANSEEDADKKSEVTTTDMKSEISKIVHLGVTDSISFDVSGLVNTNFVYLSTIQNSHSAMINRYNYSNESAQ